MILGLTAAHQSLIVKRPHCLDQMMANALPLIMLAIRPASNDKTTSGVGVSFVKYAERLSREWVGRLL